jgi:hypothetical protein
MYVGIKIAASIAIIEIENSQSCAERVMQAFVTHLAGDVTHNCHYNIAI